MVGGETSPAIMSSSVDISVPSLSLLPLLLPLLVSFLHSSSLKILTAFYAPWRDHKGGGIGVLHSIGVEIA